MRDSGWEERVVCRVGRIGRFVNVKRVTEVAVVGKRGGGQKKC